MTSALHAEGREFDPRSEQIFLPSFCKNYESFLQARGFLGPETPKFGWCSWLSRAPNTREVPSSILGSNSFFCVFFRYRLASLGPCGVFFSVRSAAQTEL